MTHTFDILANLSVQHGYYNRNPFQGFRYLPTGRTADFMLRNDLVWVQNHGRTQLATPSVRQADGNHIHPSVNVPFSLLFLIENTEACLENISRLPERKSNESLLFSTLLTNENNPTDWPTEAVVEWGSTFHIPKADWLDGALTDCNGQPVSITPVNQDGFVILNTTSLDEDVYRLTTTAGVRYLCNVDLGFRAKPFGLLHVATCTALLEGSRLLSPTYTLRMEATESFWEYLIPEQSVKKYVTENLWVDVSDQSVEFTRQAPGEGRPYLSFTSSAPIRLEDSKSIRFRLKRTNNNGAQDTILLSDLPFPSPATFPRKENGRITSPIFVYV